MRSVVSEWPLVVFTSVAPLCAGVWIVAAFLALFDVFPEANAMTMGVPGVVLCLLLAAALACSTLHLGKPLKALRAFMRLGNSAVSNEVFMGTLFVVASCFYVVLAQRLTAEGDLWKIPLAFVAGCAMLFVLFQCLAYRMRTVPTWSSPSFSVEFAIIALLGGVVTAGVALVASGVGDESVRVGLVIAEVLCCAAAVLAVHAQGTVAAKSLGARLSASRLLGEWGTLGVVRVLSIVVGSALWGFGMLGAGSSVWWTVLGMALVLVGIVAGRCSFYRFYANVGLPQS